jgi:hypothetical protein
MPKGLSDLSRALQLLGTQLDQSSEGDLFQLVDRGYVWVCELGRRMVTAGV